MAIAEYKNAQTVEQAIEMLAAGGDTTRVLAGGTDLIIQTKPVAGAPITVVDVKHIDTMMAATIDEQGLHLGPAMSCAEFTARKDIKTLYPGLVEAAYLIGSTQVQGRASVGGNLCNASVSYTHLTLPTIYSV